MMIDGAGSQISGLEGCDNGIWRVSYAASYICIYISFQLMH
jgi:hypothetical protein